MQYFYLKNNNLRKNYLTLWKERNITYKLDQFSFQDFYTNCIYITNLYDTCFSKEFKKKS